MGEPSGSNPHPETDPPSASLSRTTREATPKRLNLLLAEDNLPDALLVREALKMENLPVEVFMAADGEQAVNFIAKADSNPDAPCPHVLLLDLNLPKIEGFEVLHRLRDSEKCKNIPVIIVSSSDSPRDRSHAAKLGASYFRKPVSYEEFLKIGSFLRTFLKDKGLL